MKWKTLKVDDMPIAYAEQGEGTPILYIHGNTGSSLWWERVMDIPGARTVALDMPNFGRSGPLVGEITIDAYADAVVHFSAALGLERPLLVGHSLGGCVAMSMAARYPDRWRGIVLVDSGAPSGLATPEARYPTLDAMRTNRPLLELALGNVAPTLSDKAFLSALAEDASRMAAPAWVGNAIALGKFDYSGRLASFVGPVLVIWGRKDIIITEAMARETVAAIPNAMFEILESVGHSVNVEDPELFKQLMVDNFARIK